MSSVILRTKGVAKSFGGIAALQGVSLGVPRGSIYGIVGPNGAGKSVLFNVITGFLPPDDGRVWLDDQELTGLPPYAVVARGVGRTFQEPRVFHSLTLLENVLLALLPKGLMASFGTLYRRPWAPVPRHMMMRAEESLREVGLWEKRQERAEGLSYGQQKLLALACAVALRPQLILLDEPTAGVNPRVIEQILQRIRALHAAGLTFVIVEHNMKVIATLCSRVLVLSQGIALVEGTPAEIQADPRVIEVYLGT